MAKIIRDGGIVDDIWKMIPDTLIEDSAATKEYSNQDHSNSILPVSCWHDWDASPKEGNELTPGVWLAADQPLEVIENIIPRVGLIAIKFPEFTDGIGFSLASVLREYYQFSGELRAFGNILPDQAPYLRRCGFNSIALDEDSLGLALGFLLDGKLTYQGSVFSGRTPFRFRYNINAIENTQQSHSANQKGEKPL